MNVPVLCVATAHVANVLLDARTHMIVASCHEEIELMYRYITGLHVRSIYYVSRAQPWYYKSKVREFIDSLDVPLGYFQHSYGIISPASFTQKKADALLRVPFIPLTTRAMKLHLFEKEASLEQIQFIS